MCYSRFRYYCHYSIIIVNVVITVIDVSAITASVIINASVIMITHFDPNYYHHHYLHHYLSIFSISSLIPVSCAVTWNSQVYYLIVICHLVIGCQVMTSYLDCIACILKSHKILHLSLTVSDSGACFLLFFFLSFSSCCYCIFQCGNYAFLYKHSSVFSYQPSVFLYSFPIILLHLLK